MDDESAKRSNKAGELRESPGTVEYQRAVPSLGLEPSGACAVGPAAAHQVDASLDSDGLDDTDLDLDIANDT